MFRVIILGECALIMAIALLAYILIQNSEDLKNTRKGKVIVIFIMTMAFVLFLLSFDNIRLSLKNIIW